MTTYNSFELLDQVSPAFEGVDKTVNRSLLVLDSTTGKRVIFDRSGLASEVKSFKWCFYTRADFKVLETFLNARKGRLVPFWVPTYTNDLALSANIGAADQALTIYKSYYTALLFAKPNKKHLAFITRSGTIYTRAITSAVENVNGTETLTFSGSLGVTITPKEMISYLQLCRLADDEVRIQWLNKNAGECTFNCIEIPQDIP